MLIFGVFWYLWQVSLHLYHVPEPNTNLDRPNIHNLECHGRNAVLLLTVTATLNVAMWLWVVSTAVFCMLGVDAAEDCCRCVSWAEQRVLSLRKEQLRKAGAEASSGPCEVESQAGQCSTLKEAV